MRKKPLLLIEWEDFATYASWRGEDKAADVDPMICHTIGWKMKAPKGKICVASSRNSVGECAERTIITKGAIKSIRRLE